MWIARARTGYCGVLRGYYGRARRSARAPLRVALRDGTAGGSAGHVRWRPAAKLPGRAAAAWHAALPGPTRSEETLGPVLRRATLPEPGLGALSDARYSGRRLCIPAAQEVSPVQWQEDQRARQDKDGVHRQQTAEVHNVLEAEDRDYEEGGLRRPLLAIFHMDRPDRQLLKYLHLWKCIETMQVYAIASGSNSVLYNL